LIYHVNINPKLLHIPKSLNDYPSTQAAPRMTGSAPITAPIKVLRGVITFNGV
jgi:hypothetical protein